jgi:hypothetical protein
MRSNTFEKLISLGFDSDLIKKIDEKSLTLSSLRGTSKEALEKNGFTMEEAELIVRKVNRENIPDDVVKVILQQSGEVCCYCRDGNNSRPFQIHHIEEYHISQNNNENNLLLVCPNHHTTIHRNKITRQQQLFQKMSWNNIWSIAEDYKSKGQIFPFGAFEMQDYTTPSSITEVFSFRPPQGSVCLSLCKGNTANQSEEILKKYNRLILSGNSGSGKTTMAIGVGGKFKDYDTYKYIVGDKNSIEASQEILLFLSFAVKKVIIIIDDANTKLHPDQIEQILGVAQLNTKIIIVNTRNSFKSDHSIEEHFVNCVQYINWEILQQDIKGILVDNETEIVAFLNDNNINEYHGEKIGYSIFDQKFKDLLDKYSSQTKTVWELIFLLGGGLSRVMSRYSELHSSDRFDLVVTYIAVNQIAYVEAGMGIEDILQLYNIIPVLSKSPPPTAVWLKNKLDELCDARILKEERGRYRTIHRQYAKVYIETGYLFDKVSTEIIFASFFSDATKVKQIVILWSWFRLTPINSYISSWYRSLTIQEWRKLADNAHDFSTFALLAHQMHIIAPGEGNKIIKEVFEDKVEVISNFINTSTDSSVLFYFNELITPLRYHCKSIIKPMLDAINKEHLLLIIRNAEPDIFYYLNFIFNTLFEAYPEWTADLCKELTQEDFKIISGRCKIGAVDRLYNIVGFQRRYCNNIMRSEFKFYVNKIGSLMKDCPLSDLKYPQLFTMNMTELLYYEHDINDILNNLDPKGLAEEYVNSTPNEWGALLSISMLSKYSSSKQIENFVNNLDEKKLQSNIEKFLYGNFHELKILIHQMKYGNKEKVKSLALMLKPIIEKIYSRQDPKPYSDDILEAYMRLDKELATEIAIKLGKTITFDFEEPNRDDVEDEYLEKAEASGQDYLMIKMKVE